MEENYQQYFDEEGQISNEGIIRLPDHAWIPNNVLNKDWVQYLYWLSQGNTPLPPDQK